jgi:beta-alanine degradation protein BauB
MKTTTKTIAGALVLLGAIAGIAGADEAATGRTEAKDVKWFETGFGPMAAAVYGDLSKGQHLTMVKFAPGMKTPVHIHSADYIAVVVQGQWKHFEPGKPETETVLGPGSHWFIKGDAKHISECVGPEECISVVMQEKPFDYKPME